MKILHIAPWPGPPFSGANINHYNYFKRLTLKHRSRFIVISSSVAKTEISSRALSDLGIRNDGVELVEHRPATKADLFVALVSNRLPPAVAFLESEVGEISRKISSNVISEWRPDVLVIWWYAWASIFAEIQDIPKVLYACDSISLANHSASLSAKSVLRRTYYHVSSLRYSRFERALFPLYNEVIFISQRDAHHANANGSIPATVICNGVDITELAPLVNYSKVPSVPVIAFHGHLAFPPNEESVEFLVTSIGKRLEQEFSSEGFEIRVIGAGAGSRLLALRRDNPWLNLMGYVEDLRTSLATSTIYVIPTLAGSGVKNKVLDAMACGLPIVGTPEAFSGLDLIPGVHCVACDRESMSHEVVHLALDPARRKSLGVAAREWVEKNADWDAQTELLETVLRRAAASADGVSAVSP